MATEKTSDTGKLDALGLLKDFKRALEEKRVSFIADGDESVTAPVKKLIRLFEVAKDQLERRRGESADEEPKKQSTAGNERLDLADFLPWHEVHKAGLKLWKQLMRAAISSIDPGAKGHSQLLEYLEAATHFEDLLYGLAPFYRDHTLHSLWVYLIGVRLMGKRGELGEIAENLNWYVCNDVKEEEYPEALVEWACLEERYLNDVLQKKRDAIWCIIALCHDLGYSLAKLPDLNKKVEAVLKFYDVAEFRHVGYTLDLEHQYLVTQFLELMAMDVRITPGNDYPEDAGDSNEDTRERNEKDLLACFPAAKKNIAETLRKDRDLDLHKLPDLRELLMYAVANLKKGPRDPKDLEDLAKRAYDNVLTKCYRDDSSYWRLGKALERKEHGILSAYLLYKTMGLFADTSVRSPAEEWGLEDEEAVDNIIRGDILFAIAQHEFAYAHIYQMSSLAEILILCDELEEFSRLGRQLQSRTYHDTTANTAIEINLHPGNGHPDPTNTEVDIGMTYDSCHLKRADFAKFCWRKARRLCRLFSLGSRKKGKDKNEEMYQIKEIKTTFKYPDKAADGKSKPGYVIIFTMQKEDRGVTIQLNSSKPVKLECRDDDVYEAGKPDCSLRKWLMNKDQLNIKDKDWSETE